MKEHVAELDRAATRDRANAADLPERVGRHERISL
jgi:hypothetical protein